MERRKPFFLRSLRSRVALGFAFPIFIILGIFSIIHANRDLKLLGDQARITALQLGDLMIHSLNLSMLSDTGGHIVTTLEDISKLESVENVKIVGMSGKVLAENPLQVSPKVFSIDDAECDVCHQFADTEVPNIIALENSAASWRVSAPINNLPECNQCHDADMPHLGVLLMDISVEENRKHLAQDFKEDIVLSALGTLLISLSSYLFIHWLIIRRFDRLQKPLAEFAKGDFTTRLPEPAKMQDELDQFVITFNQMADELGRHIRDSETRHNLREKAIMGERERIARELHDGMAQVLGYVNTKASAVRLFIKDNKLKEADQHLANLEEAAQRLFVDVREAILGLRMSVETENGLVPALRKYVSQFSKLSGIPTVLDAPDMIWFNGKIPGIELHLFRIVQESLSNIRKHSIASQAWVELWAHGDQLQLAIRDNGIGFDVNEFSDRDSQSFGIKTMHERASEIGAKIRVDSKPHGGTRILVELANHGNKN